MKTGRKAANGLATATVGGAVTALVTFFGSGASVAEPTSVSIDYTCPFPLIAEQTVTADVSTDLPSEVEVGESTPELVIDVTAHVPAGSTRGLGAVDAATLEGTVTAEATVTTPSTELPIQLELDIPQTDVPDSGAFTMELSATAPALTFQNPGTASIDVGDIDMTLTPRKADGSKTGLETFESVCTMPGGQDTQLGSFAIVEPPTTTTTSSDSTTTTSSEPGGDTEINYSVEGQSHVQKLGSDLALNGSFDAMVDIAGGTFEGDLQLQEAPIEFQLFSFLPATAQVKVDDVGGTSGTIATSGAVTATSNVSIGLTEINVLGIPVVSDSSGCQTVETTPVELTSGEGFDPLSGGTLSGEYAIPEFENCGFTTPIVNATASGPGNTISLDLARQS